MASGLTTSAPGLFKTPVTAALREAAEHGLVLFVGIAALAAMFLAHLSELTFVDPDLWHEMALAREIFTLGYMPLDERFAYTPTVYPCVHHEWGTGLVLYLVASVAGAGGIMALKYLLSAVVATTCFRCAELRGASRPLVTSLAPLVILAGCLGFTTIRAQLFTMGFLALLLTFLDADRRGERRWIWVWLPLYVVWLNLHAGFVVGGIVVTLHAVEQLVRREPVRHLIALVAAMAALVMVNPYGWNYYPYLAHAVLMQRPMIIEWRPLWENDPTTFYVYLMSLVLVGYAVSQLGVRRMPGLLILLVTAYAAARHTRHLSLYLVVWLAYLPGYLQATRLGALVESLWNTRRKLVASFCAVVGVLCAARALAAHPWKMALPVTIEQEKTGRPMYPAGAVDYLRETDFRGNLMTPFVPGGFVMWKLHPNVKVSFDGRYEVAYQPGALEEHESFYRAEAGWEKILEKHPTDLVLVPRSTAVSAALAEQTAWQRVYRDGAYEIYSRPGLRLPTFDRRNDVPAARFP
jgi:hypothetical protein